MPYDPIKTFSPEQGAAIADLYMKQVMPGVSYAPKQLQLPATEPAVAYTQAPAPQPAARAPMSFELQKLLNHYGVANASKPAYAGAAKPASGADDYQALLDKYNADNTAYTDWAKEYDSRMQTPMYGPGYQGAPLQALAYKYGPQAGTPNTAGPVKPITENPAGQSSLNSGNGGGFDGSLGNGFAGNPNSLSGGLLGAMIGQDPTNVGVTDMSSMSLGAMSEGAQAAANAGLGNQAAAGMTGFGGVGTDPSVGGFGDGLGGVGGMSDAGDMGGMSEGYGGAMGGMSDSSSDSGSDSGGDSDGGGWALGGLVRKYADGGEVQDFGGYGIDPSVVLDAPSPGANVEGNRGLDVSRLTPAQAQFLAQQDPQAMARGVARFNQIEPMQETLPQMAAAYASPEMDLYTQEYQAARQRAAEDRARFEQLLQASLDRKDETGPSKAEMYFQLAAAFGAPTKTGSFGESLAGANTVLAGHQKGIREANLSARDRKDKLALEVAKYRADGSKDDLTNLRTLTVEEMKARRLALDPKSEIGKEAADLGLIKGTPEYDQYVRMRTAQIAANKEPPSHFIPGPDGTTLEIPRGGKAKLVTDESGNPIIAPDYAESKSPPTASLGLPVPSAVPWANQSNPKSANAVKAAEAARGAKELEADADAAKKSAEKAVAAQRFMNLNTTVETNTAMDQIPLTQVARGYWTPEVKDMMSITATLTPGLRDPGSGSSSDFDAKMFQRGTVGVDKPKSVNDNIAKGYLLKARNDQDYVDFRQEYLAQNGTLAGANSHWRKYAEANPIFDPTSPDVPAINNSRQGWRDFFSKGAAEAPVTPQAKPTSLAEAAAAELANRKGRK